MRLAVTILAVVIAASFVAAIFWMSRTPAAPDATPSTPQVAGGEIPTPVGATTEIKAPAQLDSVAPIPSAEQPPVAELGTLSVVPVSPNYQTTIGSINPKGGYVFEAEISAFGPGIRQIHLTKYRETPQGEQPYAMFDPFQVEGQGVRYPFAAVRLQINGQTIELLGKPWELLDHNTTQTRYRLQLADAQGTVVLEIVREFAVQPGSYDLTVRQQFINHTDQPLELTWHQHAQGDVALDRDAYMGDQRSLVAGYLDPKETYIYTTDRNRRRTTTLDALAEGRPFWPDPDATEGARLMWFAALNRYFAAVTHPLPGDDAVQAGLSDNWSLEREYGKIDILSGGTHGSDRRHDYRKMVFTLASRPFIVPPRQESRRDLGLFAGPRQQDTFEQNPLFSALKFDNLIIYNLGGFCAFCTFQWLAHLLMWFMRLIHAVVFDWGLAIIVLVCVVRLILHPITKKSQMNMMKMGKQMQALQPEMEKIRKKYADDKQKLASEQMRLYKEQGVNPVNMLGCLPMVLQMPIWFALYAMLYFAIELRHQPAFFNVFHNAAQALTGHEWLFLTDLSGPDRFIQLFDEHKYVNLLWLIPFDYSSINLFPILMAVVFFLQQKLTMTPAATDEQRKQQRMMAVMTTVLFPVMMFSVPSGLTLYIMTSTAIGIVESWIVRKHIKEQEANGTLFTKKAPPKPGGLMDRLQKAVEAKQRDLKKRGDNGDDKRPRR